MSVSVSASSARRAAGGLIMTMTVAAAPAAARPGDVTSIDKLLAFSATVLLVAALTAIAKGYGGWNQIPANVWLHLSTILIATALTPVMLLRPRGDRLHRQLGYVWVAAMFLTAAISLDIRLINRGGFSPIHILSVFTMLQVPLLVWRARQRDWKRHRQAVRLMVAGALLAAGFFTFPFGRLMGNWLFA
jgi:uncharacterized membrane protein